jgi:multicomponent Na+:H+ antiporter subunit C
MLEYVVSKFNFWTYVILVGIGLYAMIGKKNLVKKLIGMNIMQSAVILFYVSVGAKKGGGQQCLYLWETLTQRMGMEFMKS